MPWPTPDVLGKPFDALAGRWGALNSQGAVSPTAYGSLAFWYKINDVSSLRNAAGAVPSTGEAIALVGDTSENSTVNCFASNVAAGNNCTSPDKTVTGDQTITLDLALEDYSPAADVTVVNKLSGNDGIKVLVLTTGVVRLQIGDGASVTNVDSSASFSMTDLTRYTVGIVWTDGVGASFTKDGSAVGTPVAAVKTLTNAAVVCTIGTVTGKIFRCQIGSVYDFNPSLSVKKVVNGATFSSGGDTWTLVTTGDLGGRICGARDLVQLTAANQPVLTIADGGNYITGDGSNDYMKAAAFALSQPTSIYGALSQISWTANDFILDGASMSNSGALKQVTATPQYFAYAGGTGSLTNSNFAVNTRAIISVVFNGASSSNRVNRLAAVTGSSGDAVRSMNGVVIGATADGSAPSNITVSEVLVYAAAHDTITQNRIINYLTRKWGIVV